jgi:hypothetical protein
MRSIQERNRHSLNLLTKEQGKEEERAIKKRWGWGKKHLRTWGI